MADYVSGGGLGPTTCVQSFIVCDQCDTHERDFIIPGYKTDVLYKSFLSTEPNTKFNIPHNVKSNFINYKTFTKKF